MHGQFEKPGRDDSSIRRKIGVGFLVLPVCVVIALFALARTQPSTSNWIAEAVQAEFTGDTVPPSEAPTQLAEPATEPRNMAGGWLDAIKTAHSGQR